MHRIAAKAALIVGLVTAASGILIALLAGMSPFWMVPAAMIASAAAYAVVRGLVTGRLEHLDAVLNQLRIEAGRAQAGGGGDGDEIDRLSRRGDQALHAVTKRIAELSRADHYRRDFIGDVSHEIKTPIFAIQGFAETLLGGALEDPEVNRGFVERILQNANRLSALARDLNEISRLETGMIKLARGAFDVSRMFEEVRDALIVAIQKKQIEVHVTVDSQARYADADRERVRQVVTNLAENAIKYGKESGRIEMGAERLDGYVKMYVRDDGIGIAPEDVPRVTERFYRVDRSRARGQGGTGLGLAIVKHILAAHRTELKIESALDKGSIFSFLLPASDEMAHHAGRVSV